MYGPKPCLRSAEGQDISEESLAMQAAILAEDMNDKDQARGKYSAHAFWLYFAYCFLICMEATLQSVIKVQCNVLCCRSSGETFR